MKKIISTIALATICLSQTFAQAEAYVSPYGGTGTGAAQVVGQSYTPQYNQPAQSNYSDFYLKYHQQNSQPQQIKYIPFSFKQGYEIYSTNSAGIFVKTGEVLPDPSNSFWIVYSLINGNLIQTGTIKY